MQVQHRGFRRTILPIIHVAGMGGTGIAGNKGKKTLEAAGQIGGGMEGQFAFYAFMDGLVPSSS